MNLDRLLQPQSVALEQHTGAENPYRVPVMTNSESIADLGPNAYGQPTVALNILREHILGRGQPR